MNSTTGFGPEQFVFFNEPGPRGRTAINLSADSMKKRSCASMPRVQRIGVFALLTTVLFASFTKGEQIPATKAEASAHARASAVALLRFYNHDTALFNTTGWWNSANAVTALADERRLTGDPEPRDLFSDILVNAPRKYPGFLNNFYDDEGWWALAWIDVYELAPHAPAATRYIQVASAIFNDMTGGWDSTCGGGIWWSKDRKYKNAIANELFLSVAAKLALHSKGRRKKLLLEWANREWRWFSQTGMINSDNLVNDGLNEACRNNGRTTWTYNQGVILGGLAALSKNQKREDLAPTAHRIAIAAIGHLTDRQGILHDACEPDCGEDGVSFKGIFNRNLRELETIDADPVFLNFLKTNAQSLWENARTPGNCFPTVWSGPPSAGNAGAQTSALDAFNAAIP
jgi:predicted alpha-1,6-mannanase (GH76 family)